MPSTHAIRDSFFFGALLLFCALFADGQSFGPYSITGTGCTRPIDLSEKATVTYQVIGSWSGTIQPEVSVGAQPPVNTTATPAATTSPAATITANGAYFSNVSGYSFFLLCGASVTNTATIYINVSSAPR